MIQSKIKLSAIALCSCLFAASAMASSDPTILVTGTIFNNTFDQWSGHYSFAYQDGLTHNIRVNINKNIIMNSGRFIIPVKLGKTYHVSLGYRLGYRNPKDHRRYIVCSFTIKADTPTHATMREDASVLRSDVPAEVPYCYFSGDPNQNTATIELTRTKQG